MSAPAKHTPGPWIARMVGEGRIGASVCALEGGEAVASCRVYPRTREAGARANANARLIAAAPDLLAIAESFEVRVPDADGDVWLVIKEAGVRGEGAVNLGKADRAVAQVAALLEESRRAAVAKARGEA
jgi:hypothetical protein